jgi:hypothetical protein
LDYFNASDFILNSDQYSAAVIIIRKNNRTQNFIDDWLFLLNNNRELFRDDHNSEENLPGFIENRHDQSALSLLVKKSHLKLLTIDYAINHDDLIIQFWSKDRPFKYLYNFLKIHLDEHFFRIVLNLSRKFSKILSFLDSKKS